MINIAVILAGGSGTRMGLGRPKQFLMMAGRTILEHSVSAFVDNGFVDHVIIVSNADFTSDVEAIVARHRAAGEWGKVRAVVAGGRERSDSSVNALRYIVDELLAGAGETPASAPDAATAGGVGVLFHDAVRPLVDQRIIDEVCAALGESAAVNVTLPVVDTIVRVESGRMSGVVDRSMLQRVQTPQGFRLDTIAEAYRRALADPDFRATDDCGVVMRYMPEVPIGVVRGSEHNLKLTYRDDIPLFEFLLAGARGAMP